MNVRAEPQPRSDDRAWLLRALLVLGSPGSVFAAMRDDSRPSAEARQEPVLALIWLAGIAGVLATSTASTFLDQSSRDGVAVALWSFIGGGIYGVALYFLAGKILQLGVRGVGGRATYRQARHVLGFAAAPIALSLLLYWPLRIAIYGSDLFQRGGGDGHGVGRVVGWAFYAFVAWTLALLAVGVRALLAWSWSRSVAAVGLAVMIGGALFLVLDEFFG